MYVIQGKNGLGEGATMWTSDIESVEIYIAHIFSICPELKLADEWTNPVQKITVKVSNDKNC